MWCSFAISGLFLLLKARPTLGGASAFAAVEHRTRSSGGSAGESILRTGPVVNQIYQFRPGRAGSANIVVAPPEVIEEATFLDASKKPDFMPLEATQSADQLKQFLSDLIAQQRENIHKNDAAACRNGTASTTAEPATDAPTEPPTEAVSLKFSVVTPTSGPAAKITVSTVAAAPATGTSERAAEVDETTRKSFERMGEIWLEAARQLPANYTSAALARLAQQLNAAVGGTAV